MSLVFPGMIFGYAAWRAGAIRCRAGRAEPGHGFRSPDRTSLPHEVAHHPPAEGGRDGDERPTRRHDLSYELALGNVGTLRHGITTVSKAKAPWLRRQDQPLVHVHVLGYEASEFPVPFPGVVLCVVLSVHARDDTERLHECLE
jgi:hypothetical protein